MNRPLVPAGPGGLAEDAHVFLEGGDQIGQYLDGDGDLGADGGADDVGRLRLLDVVFREREDLAERQREVEGRMGNRAEVGVDPRASPLSSGTMVKLICLRSSMKR